MERCKRDQSVWGSCSGLPPSSPAFPLLSAHSGFWQWSGTVRAAQRAPRRARARYAEGASGDAPEIHFGRVTTPGQRRADMRLRFAV